MRFVKSIGSYIFVAVLASAVTMLIGMATFAGASVHELNGTVYQQTCSVNATVSECSAGQGCRQVKDPMGHVANGRGEELICRYP